ncbi:MAG: two-component regulator propeller domain-containing protein [Chitinophagaceae bacterium]|nr:two-component regulator propeller domain-containing protein [Chitinophagaceae bacterium]
MALKKFFYLILIFFATMAEAQSPIPPIGQWREHLPYRSAIGVVAAGEKIYCATPYSLFSVDTDEQSIERYSRMTGLNETGLSCMAYEPVSGKLLIAYANSNIDIIYRNDIFNIPDIKREVVTGDKRVYAATAIQGDFFLSTGLGVIRVNPDQYEIRSTWLIGNVGTPVKVNSLVLFNGLYHAATAEGLKKVSGPNADPSFFGNWETLSGQNGLPAGECRDLVVANNTLYALVGNQVFILGSNGQWSLIHNSPGWSVNSISPAGNNIFICQSQPGQGRVLEINNSGVLLNSLQSGLLVPMAAIRQNNLTWVADQVNSLIRFDGAGASSFRPNSPDSIALGGLFASDGTLWASAGSRAGANNKNGLYQLDNGEWKNYNGRNFPALDSLPDMVTVVADPKSDTAWAGSFGGGLLRITPADGLTIFKQNSPLSPALFASGIYRVAGLAMDNDGHLWISNDGAASRLQVRKKDGAWLSFDPPFSTANRSMGSLLIDGSGQKWMISPGGNGLFCFNDKNTLDQPSDDQWKWFRQGGGQGNLPSNRVLSLALDKSGFVWIGTDDGIGIIQCPESVFGSPACEAIIPVVLQGNFAGFLFKGEEVRGIAVDGADRKWVATGSGVFLISPEGEKIIYQFNESNSPLLSNDVQQVTIDGSTGEVFFATANGLCSFRSTATEGGVTHSNVLVFPNPVPPGYGGTIGIKGLAENATVKITELDGRLVFQTRALGGQAVWDGKDYRGRRISTGVYLVLVSDGKKETFATKIVFISQ